MSLFQFKLSRVSAALTLVAGLLGAFTPGQAQAAEAHPRLLFGAAEVAGLKEKVKTEPYASMLAALQATAEDATEDNADGTSPAYPDTHIAIKCAFLYQLTGDPTWAQKAQARVEARLTDTKVKWADPTLKGLTSYMEAKGVALAYDMAFDAWQPAFQTLVSQKLKDMADMLIDSGGTEQNTDPASNWQANRYAAAALALLATDVAIDEASLSASQAKIARYLSENLGNGPTSRGWNIEGLGYTFYPWGFVGPAGIALTRHNPALDIRKAVPGTAYALWSVFATLTKIAPNIHPDFGDDNNRARGEGSYGLSFWTSAAALKPGLAYWYDHIEGNAGTREWDGARAGTIYSILFHPGNSVVPADPLTIAEWQSGFDDRGGNGYFTFRNRYRDADDMVAQVYAKLRGNKGHSGPDALSFRLLGAGNAWAIGGGRYGTGNVYYRSQDTLYKADPDEGALTVNGNSGEVVDGAFRPDGSGWVVTQMATTNLGVSKHKRRFLAEHSGASGVEAVYVVADTSVDGKYWQLVTTPDNAIAITDAGFDVAGVAGASLRATVVYAAGPRGTKVGRRARGTSFSFLDKAYTDNGYVHTQSSDGNHLLVLSVAKAGQTHPTVKASGNGILQTLEVGALKIKVLEDSFEVTGNDVPPLGGTVDPGGGNPAGSAAGAAGAGGPAGIGGAAVTMSPGAGSPAVTPAGGSAASGESAAAGPSESGACGCAVPGGSSPSNFHALFWLGYLGWSLRRRQSR